MVNNSSGCFFTLYVVFVLDKWILNQGSAAAPLAACGKIENLAEAEALKSFKKKNSYCNNNYEWNKTASVKDFLKI